MDIKLYLHKNVVKKIKREENLLKYLVDFIFEFDDYLLSENLEKLVYISHDIYIDKLLYNNNVIFDISDNLDEIIVWDLGKTIKDFNIKNISEYVHKNISSIIEGNQFIKKHIKIKTKESIQEDIYSIKNSKSIENDYCLDYYQKKVLEEFNNGLYNSNQGICGPAGCGKTLMLNRMAYESILKNNSYVYIAFTTTLKDKFYQFVENSVLNSDKNIKDNSNIYTYEEFLRYYISPKLKIDANLYITFNECSLLIKSFLNDYNLGIQNKISLSINDITRMIMSMGINLENYSSDNIIQNIFSRIEKLESKGELYISEDDLINLEILVDKVITTVYKKLKKRLWSDFLKDINDSLYDDIEYVKENIIFIDEMQDLSSIEFDILYKIIKNSSKKEKKVVLAYDANQKISYDGSSDANLENRLKKLKTNPISLKYSYRNSYNILALSKYFLESDDKETKDYKLNINPNKVKILIEDDIKHVISTCYTKFLPEENLNIGIIAFGKTYEKYRDSFIDENGKSKFLGIEFFNEEQVKGLEFSNIIILDFMEPYKSNNNISIIDMRRWYVSITRACDNLLVHFTNEDDVDKLSEYILNENKINLKDDYLLNEKLTLYTKDCENAFDTFEQDLFISLGNEQNSLILKRVSTLILSYEKSKDQELLDEAIDLLYKINSLNTLINTLELLVDKNKKIYLELIYASIKMNLKEKVSNYIKFIDKADYWRILDFAKLNNECVYDYLTCNLGIKGKKDNFIKKLNSEIKLLKSKKEFDNIIKIYNKENLFFDIIEFYETNKNYFYKNKKFIYDNNCINTIIKSYLRLEKYNEAINLCIETDNILKAISIYEIYLNDILSAYKLCRKYVDKKHHNEIVKKCIDLALKLNDIKILNNMINFSRSKNETYKYDLLNFNAYVLTKENKFLLNSIEIYYKNEDYKGVIRCFRKNESVFKKIDTKFLVYIADSFEKDKQIYNSAVIYQNLCNYKKATELFYENNNYDKIIEIYDLNKSDIEYKTNYANYLITSYENLDEFDEAINICEFIENIPKAINIAYSNNLFDKVIDLYKNYNPIKFDKSHTVESKTDIINTYSNIKDCAIKLNQNVLAGNICIKNLNNFYEGICLYYDAKEYTLVIELFENKYKKLKNIQLKNENFINNLLYENLDISDKNYIDNNTHKVNMELFKDLINKIIRIYNDQNNYEKCIEIYELINSRKIYKSEEYCNEIIKTYYILNRFKDICDFYKSNNINKYYTAESLNYIFESLDKENQISYAIDIGVNLIGIQLRYLKHYYDILNYKSIDCFNLEVINKEVFDLISNKKISEISLDEIKEYHENELCDIFINNEIISKFKNISVKKFFGKDLLEECHKNINDKIYYILKNKNKISDLSLKNIEKYIKQYENTISNISNLKANIKEIMYVHLLRAILKQNRKINCLEGDSICPSQMKLLINLKNIEYDRQKQDTKILLNEIFSIINNNSLNNLNDIIKFQTTLENFNNDIKKLNNEKNEKEKILELVKETHNLQLSIHDKEIKLNKLKKLEKRKQNNNCNKKDLEDIKKLEEAKLEKEQKIEKVEKKYKQRENKLIEFESVEIQTSLKELKSLEIDKNDYYEILKKLDSEILENNKKLEEQKSTCVNKKISKIVEFINDEDFKKLLYFSNNLNISAKNNLKISINNLSQYHFNKLINKNKLITIIDLIENFEFTKIIQHDINNLNIKSINLENNNLEIYLQNISENKLNKLHNKVKINKFNKILDLIVFDEFKEQIKNNIDNLNIESIYLENKGKTSSDLVVEISKLNNNFEVSQFKLENKNQKIDIINLDDSSFIIKILNLKNSKIKESNIKNNSLMFKFSNLEIYIKELPKKINNKTVSDVVINVMKLNKSQYQKINNKFKNIKIYDDKLDINFNQDKNYAHFELTNFEENDLFNLNNEFSKLDDKINCLECELINKNDVLNEEKQLVKAEINLLDNKISNISKEINKINNEIRDIDNKINKLKEEIEELKDNEIPELNIKIKYMKNDCKLKIDTLIKNYTTEELYPIIKKDAIVKELDKKIEYIENEIASKEKTKKDSESNIKELEQIKENMKYGVIDLVDSLEKINFFKCVNINSQSVISDLISLIEKPNITLVEDNEKSLEDINKEQNKTKNIEYDKQSKKLEIKDIKYDNKLKKKEKNICMNINEIDKTVLEKIEKQILINVVKKAIVNGNITDEQISEITGIDAKEIEFVKMVLNSDTDLIKMILN